MLFIIFVMSLAGDEIKLQIAKLAKQSVSRPAISAKNNSKSGFGYYPIPTPFRYVPIDTTKELNRNLIDSNKTMNYSDLLYIPNPKSSYFYHRINRPTEPR